MVSVEVSWSEKNWCLFHWSAENKSWPELLHWSVEDFITAWMLSTLSRQWLWNPAKQCSVTPRKREVEFLRQNTTLIVADKWTSYSPDLSPLDYCIRYILWDWCTKADDTRLQIYRTTKRQSKTNEGGHHWDSSKIHCTMEQGAQLSQRGRAMLRVCSQLHHTYSAVFYYQLLRLQIY